MSPDVERYRAAFSNVEDARPNLRHHDLATQLDSYSRQLPELVSTVAALDTWQRWANGDTTTVDQPRDTVEILTVARGEQRRALGHVLDAWVGEAGIDPRMADSRRPDLQCTGIEVGLSDNAARAVRLDTAPQGRQAFKGLMHVQAG